MGDMETMAESGSSSTFDSKNDNGVLCKCRRVAKIVRAWTETNPGKRLYGCQGRKVVNGYESCNFFRWFDVDKPHGWQYLALLEARDVIRAQKLEIGNLKNKVRCLTREGGSIVENTSDLVDELKETREDCEALRREVLILNERCRVFRNVLITSLVGFAVVIGVIMGVSK